MTVDIIKFATTPSLHVKLYAILTKNDMHEIVLCSLSLSAYLGMAKLRIDPNVFASCVDKAVSIERFPAYCSV